MPRPVRIDDEGVCYHVMNCGRGRRPIFHGIGYCHAFLDTLAEAHERFGIVIHGYCLMDHHDPLLLQPSQGNLGRVMRHMNGVYPRGRTG